MPLLQLEATAERGGLLLKWLTDSCGESIMFVMRKRRLPLRRVRDRDPTDDANSQKYANITSTVHAGESVKILLAVRFKTAQKNP